MIDYTVNGPTCLAEIRRDDKFEGFVLVRTAEQKQGANGKFYLDMTLADRSGSINAKMWDGTVQPPLAGSVIKIRAAGNEFNGRMQLRIELMRAARPQDNVDMSQLVPCAPEKPETMRDEIYEAAYGIADDDLRLITCRLLEKAGEALLTFPAAKQMHHAERSGLLHHTVTMLRSAKAMMKIYPQLSSSLLTAGVIIHDLSKMAEMDADALGMVADYSLDGKLVGHIVRGVVEIELAAKEAGASHEKALLLQHMMLSHHGVPEYGSPRPPMFPEAEVLHTLDTLDARLYQMFEALGRANEGGFSEKVWGLENRQLYRIPKDEIKD